MTDILPTQKDAATNLGRFKARHPGVLDARALDKYRWRFPDGESYADADARAACALIRIQEMSGRRALIVSHEMIGRMLLRRLLHLSPEEALTHKHPHNIVYCIDTITRGLTTLALPDPTDGHTRHTRPIIHTPNNGEVPRV